jgi:hypothetical protein
MKDKPLLGAHGLKEAAMRVDDIIKPAYTTKVFFIFIFYFSSKSPNKKFSQT